MTGGVRDYGSDQNPSPMMYLPVAQVPAMSWIILTRTDPHAVSALLQKKLRAYRALFSSTALSSDLMRIARLVRTFFQTSRLAHARHALANLLNTPPQNVIGDERWLSLDGARAQTLLFAARHQNGGLRHKPSETEDQARLSCWFDWWT